DFHLRGNSPAIDAGLNSATALPSVDMDGHGRILDGNKDGTAVVDMGVDEFGGSHVQLVSLSVGEARNSFDFGNQDLRHAPVITSNGGNASASVSGQENTTA